MKTYEIENTFTGMLLGRFEGETPDEAIAAMMADAGCTDAPDPELKAREVDDYDPEQDDDLDAERDGATSRMMVRTLSRCPGSPSEWQWTEACDADAPDGATVEEYVETCNDSSIETHKGVYLVRDMAPSDMADLGVEDIRGLIHREVGALVAWVGLDSTVAYEMVTEGE